MLFWPLYEKLIAEAGGADKVDFWLKPAMMHAMLEHLATNYGGVRQLFTADWFNRS